MLKNVKLIERTNIILVIIGIILVILRHFNFVYFLGFFLDGLWAYVLATSLFVVYRKYRYMAVAFLLGLSFELGQLICKILDIGQGGYYPGTPDILDVISYLIGVVIALIFCYITQKLPSK